MQIDPNICPLCGKCLQPLSHKIDRWQYLGVHLLQVHDWLYRDGNGSVNGSACLACGKRWDSVLHEHNSCRVMGQHLKTCPQFPHWLVLHALARGGVHA